MKFTVDHARKITKYVVGYSVSWVVRNALYSNTHPKTKKDVVAQRIGTYAIGFAVGEIMGDFVDRQFDSAIEKWEQLNDNS